LEWMVGPGGHCFDIEQPGSFAAVLATIDADWIQKNGAAARRHALDSYSTEAVIESYLKYYREVVDV